MTLHSFQPELYHPTFANRPPALHIKPGDSVTLSLPDAHGYDPHGIRLADFSNPLAGPIFVNDAYPGDTISITLDEIQPASDNGWSYLFPTSNTIEAALFAILPTDRQMVSWEIIRERAIARPGKPFEDLKGLEIPVAPMVGCLGVAPSLSQAITSYSSGSFGGNMDCPLLTAGTRIELPVYVEGGLLYIGDCHAAQSHGEITGAAIEIPAIVRFTVFVKKNTVIAWPRGETDDSIFTIGCGRPLDTALQRATSEMLHWLMLDFGMKPEIAALKAGQCVRYVISNIVNEVSTIACTLSKTFLP
ncbi:MAG: acetamidase [Leptolinea sp.]|nr:acetamidase [Leptolinea sp.]